jgi:hypothetical protein
LPGRLAQRGRDQPAADSGASDQVKRTKAPGEARHGTPTLGGRIVEAGQADQVFAYPEFVGPAASALSGADISWLVGFIVAGGLYTWRRRAEQEARWLRARQDRHCRTGR